MSVLKKLGFEKGDERSVKAAMYAARNAWIFTSIVLLIWFCYELITTGSVSQPLGLIFAFSQVVFSLSHIHYRKKFGG